MIRYIRISTLVYVFFVLTPHHISSEHTLSHVTSSFMQGCLIAAGVGVSVLCGKLIYDACFKERTDLEELLATEELYHAIHQEHMKIILRFNEELAILNMHDTRDNQLIALKKIVYTTKKGTHHPFLEYVKTVDTNIFHFDSQEKKLLKQRTSLLKRKLALTQTVHNEENIFLAAELSKWIEELSVLQKQLANSCDQLVTIKSYIMASEDYKQEVLLARLDYLENHLHAFSLRPNTHVVYINAISNTNGHGHRGE